MEAVPETPKSVGVVGVTLIIVTVARVTFQATVS